MSDKSTIEWTDATWNPTVGCSIVSPGCTNCYAMRTAWRFKSGYVGRQFAGPAAENVVRMVNGNPVWTGQIALAPDYAFFAPMRWKKPRKIFVNSMSDLFHESVPDEWIDRVFAVMALCPQHTFQVLTKRAERMRAYINRGGVGPRDVAYACVHFNRAGNPSSITPVNARDTMMISNAEGQSFYRINSPGSDPIMVPAEDMVAWPLPNVWLGASAERQKEADERIPHLLATPAALRFLSIEPLLGPIQIPEVIDRGTEGIWCDPLRPGSSGIGWIIVGGESGPNARPMHPQWPRDIRDQCQAAGVPFFFKQHGEWIGVPDLRSLPGGTGPGFGTYDHCQFDMNADCVRVGKKAAGRLLDGVTHDGFPEVHSCS